MAGLVSSSGFFLWGFIGSNESQCSPSLCSGSFYSGQLGAEQVLYSAGENFLVGVQEVNSAFGGRTVQ